MLIKTYFNHFNYLVPGRVCVFLSNSSLKFEIDFSNSSLFVSFWTFWYVPLTLTFFLSMEAWKSSNIIANDFPVNSLPSIDFGFARFSMNFQRF